MFRNKWCIKALSTIAVLTMVIGVVGCSNKQEKTTEQQDVQEVIVEPTGEVVAVEPTEEEIRAQYISECAYVNANSFNENSSKYKGQKVALGVYIAGLNEVQGLDSTIDNQYYYGYLFEDTSYKYDVGKQFIEIDTVEAESHEPLQDKIATIYGVFEGNKEITFKSPEERTVFMTDAGTKLVVDDNNYVEVYSAEDIEACKSKLLVYLSKMEYSEDEVKVSDGIVQRIGALLDNSLDINDSQVKLTNDIAKALRIKKSGMSKAELNKKLAKVAAKSENKAIKLFSKDSKMGKDSLRLLIQYVKYNNMLVNRTKKLSEFNESGLRLINETIEVERTKEIPIFTLKYIEFIDAKPQMVDSTVDVSKADIIRDMFPELSDVEIDDSTDEVLEALLPSKVYEQYRMFLQGVCNPDRIGATEKDWSLLIDEIQAMTNPDETGKYITNESWDNFQIWSKLPPTNTLSLEYEAPVTEEETSSSETETSSTPESSGSSSSTSSSSSSTSNSGNTSGSNDDSEGIPTAEPVIEEKKDTDDGEIAEEKRVKIPGAADETSQDALTAIAKKTKATTKTAGECTVYYGGSNREVKVQIGGYQLKGKNSRSAVIRGSKADSLLDEFDLLEEYETIERNGDELVIIHFTVTINDDDVATESDCIPNIFIRSINGTKMGGRDIPYYVIELDNSDGDDDAYNNHGSFVKEYDLVFSYPASANGFQVWFGKMQGTMFKWKYTGKEIKGYIG